MHFLCMSYLQLCSYFFFYLSLPQVIESLDAYGLTKEDLMENMKELQLVLEGDKALADHFAGIDSKVKTALTKAYDK